MPPHEEGILALDLRTKRPVGLFKGRKSTFERERKRVFDFSSEEIDLRKLYLALQATLKTTEPILMCSKMASTSAGTGQPWTKTASSISSQELMTSSFPPGNTR